MNKKNSLFFCLFFTILCLPFFPISADWIGRSADLLNFHNKKNSILICSPGRSGSTMMYGVLCKCAKGYKILKSHMLPPSKQYKGKVIFIFSNPDKAAESALHKTINDQVFGHNHFLHVESSDLNWYRKIGSTINQSKKHNLLNYDAFGCAKQLQSWLYKDTKKSSPQNAQVLAIKFEELWNPKTIAAIEQFLGIDKLQLPPLRERGYSGEELYPKEQQFRNLYNQGTEEEPIYPAYRVARALWKNAKPFEYFRLK